MTTSPEGFQGYMEMVAGHLDNLFIYTDDLLSMGKGPGKSLDLLEDLFEVLGSNNIKINMEKTLLCVNSVKYVGFEIGQLGIQPNKEKVDGIMTIPIPRTVKDIRSILGALSFYRRFIPGLASLLAPLAKLTGKKKKFEITNDHIQRLEEAKELLAKRCLLYYPDYDKMFYVHTDASEYGVGGQIFQLDDNNVPLPVYFYSRKFSKIQLRYTVVEKEALAFIAILELCYMVLKFLYVQTI